MPGMMTIELKHLRFFAYHGLFPGERKTGNHFEVDLAVKFTPPGRIKQVDETIDYVALYNIVSEKMASPTELLETLAMEIAASIHAQFPQARHVDISISKLRPPIENFEGQSTVRYQVDY